MGCKTKNSVYARANKLLKEIEKNPKHPDADLIEILKGPVLSNGLIKTWSQEEMNKFDFATKEENYGRRWRAVSKYVQSKTPKQCRERFKSLGKIMKTGQTIP